MTATGFALAALGAVVLIQLQLPLPLSAIAGFALGWLAMDLGRAIQRAGR